jgi:hypothetical protein
MILNKTEIKKKISIKLLSTFMHGKNDKTNNNYMTFTCFK